MICTSLNNCAGGDYCARCSHARFEGEGRDKRGKLWRWEFSPQYGPLFLRTDGEPLVHQPIREDHPAWEPFEAWHRKHHNAKVSGGRSTSAGLAR